MVKQAPMDNVWNIDKKIQKLHWNAILSAMTVSIKLHSHNLPTCQHSLHIHTI